MPGTRARVVRVDTATRDGSGGPSQDRIFTTPNAVIVLDGASQPDSGLHDGGWLAKTLGDGMAARLREAADRDLAETLYDAIRDVASTHGLVPGLAPSTTVSIVRWDEDRVDVLVLGDTPVIVQTRDGQVQEIRDDRLANLDERDGPIAAMDGHGFAQHLEQQWRTLVAAERSARNRPGGYWIAEATAAAAHESIRARFDSSVSAILVLTDGVSDGVDVYGTPADWTSAFALARSGVGRLIDLVDDTEDSDPHGVRWPRSKRHDDKAAALITFGGAGQR